MPRGAGCGGAGGPGAGARSAQRRGDFEEAEGGDGGGGGHQEEQAGLVRERVGQGEEGACRQRGQGGQEGPLAAHDQQDPGGAQVAGLAGGERRGGRVGGAPHGEGGQGAEQHARRGADEQAAAGRRAVAEAQPGVGAVGQTLVPGPAAQRARQQGEGSSRQVEGVARAGEQRGAQHVGEAGEREDQAAQQAAEETGPPGVGGCALGLGVAARDAVVQLLCEGEGVEDAVALAYLVVREAVGLQQGRHLVGVDGGGYERVEFAGQFVDRVGPLRVRAPPLVRDARQGGGRAQILAHQPVPSVATAAYQGSRSSAVQSSTVSTVGS